MRFRLADLFRAITALAVLLGVTFAAPLPVTAFVLSFSLLISPAVWFGGAVILQRGARAFFVGGIASGVFPFVVSAAYFFLTFLAIASGSSVHFNAVTATVDDSEQRMRLIMFGMWLTPGFCAITGGLLSWLMFRYLCPVVELAPPSCNPDATSTFHGAAEDVSGDQRATS